MSTLTLDPPLRDAPHGDGDGLLGGRTLVLNRHWAAVSTTTVRRAMVLLCRASAAVICPETFEVFDLGRWCERSTELAPALARSRVICTPRAWLVKPEIILLTAYGGVPRLEVSFSRKNLYRRDAYACQYCGRNRPPEELSIDHVVPRSRGGKTSWENCVLACVGCNTRKANKSPKEAGLRLMRPPKKPSWSPLAESLPAARPASWARFIREEPAA
jgi:5-methylcytosine-specific restriction endonuclease McrA